jgi:hypothetical protein
MTGRRSRALVLGVSAAMALVWTCPAPSQVADRIADPGRWLREDGLDVVAGQLAGLAGWSALAWLTAGLMLTWAAELPGAAGRLADRAAARTLPAGARRALAVALGITLAGASSAQAAAYPGERAAATSVPTAPLSPWPPEATTELWTPPTHRPPLRPPPDRPGDADHVDWPVADEVRVATVGPGDSLWLIAARRIGPDATAAQVAAAWPQWHAANRDVIGSDPDLLRIGQRLAPP